MGDLKEYNELVPIVRKLVGIRLRPKIRILDRCGNWKNHTHIHIANGLVHMAHKDLKLCHEGKAALLVHEFIHVKNKTGFHTKRFWKVQRQFISDKHFLRVCFSKERYTY